MFCFLKYDTFRNKNIGYFFNTGKWNYAMNFFWNKFVSFTCRVVAFGRWRNQWNARESRRLHVSSVSSLEYFNGFFHFSPEFKFATQFAQANGRHVRSLLSYSLKSVLPHLQETWHSFLKHVKPFKFLNRKLNASYRSSQHNYIGFTSEQIEISLLFVGWS